MSHAATTTTTTTTVTITFNHVGSDLSHARIPPEPLFVNHHSSTVRQQTSVDKAPTTRIPTNPGIIFFLPDRFFVKLNNATMLNATAKNAAIIPMIVTTAPAAG